MSAGAVLYQRQRAWCEGCRAVVAHLRAVRVADGWHADWTCSALAMTGGHAPRSAAYVALQSDPGAAAAARADAILAATGGGDDID